MTTIDALGARIGEQYEKAHFDRRAFPSLASEALAHSDVQALGADAIFDWITSRGAIPFQHHFDSGFGQPPITLYWRQRFYIVALCWAEATTSIHNHSFTGAYTILSGESLQTLYSFQPVHPISEQVVFGGLTLQSTRWLVKGDIERIVPGPSFIHAAFHLEAPSITLVVRTHSEQQADLPYEYLRPGLAVDPFFRDQRMTRGLQCLQLIATTMPERYEHYAARLLEHADFYTCFSILQQAAERSTRNVETLCRVAERRFGEDRVDRIDAVLGCRALDALVLKARRHIVEPGPRLLLGLLLTQPHFESIHACVSQRMSAAAATAAIARWTGVLLRSGVFKVDAEGLSDQTIEALLDGLTPASDGAIALTRASATHPLLEPLLGRAGAREKQPVAAV
jgi:hypothetical protein